MYLFLIVSFLYFLGCLFKIVNPKELIDKIDPPNNNKFYQYGDFEFENETLSDTEIETNNRKRKITVNLNSGKTIIPYKRIKSGSF